MKDEIVAKILDVLSGGDPAEARTVFLMVEIRKLLDRRRQAGDSDSLIVRFYADWVVHVQKDKLTPSVTTIMERIDRGIMANVHDRDAWKHQVDFVRFTELRQELKILFDEVGLPRHLLADEEVWRNISLALISNLADQPIVNPTPNIEYFSFKSVDHGVAVWAIKLRNEQEEFCFVDEL